MFSCSELSFFRFILVKVVLLKMFPVHNWPFHLICFQICPFSDLSFSKLTLYRCFPSRTVSLNFPLFRIIVPELYFVGFVLFQMFPFRIVFFRCSFSRTDFCFRCFLFGIIICQMCPFRNCFFVIEFAFIFPNCTFSVFSFSELSFF